MTEGFRLLRATGEFEQRDLFTTQAGRHSAELDVEFSERREGARRQPWVSIVIGKNGVGKSRILAGVANIFDVLSSGRRSRRKDEPSLSRLVYSIGNRICEVESDGAYRFHSKIDGQRCKFTELPLPTKVIALTTTPFDKFRVSRSLLRKPDADSPEVPDRYVYLGLRDRSGRASPAGTIFRAIEGLFEASQSEADRRLRTAEVFEFLGYKPHVRVRYEFTPQGIRSLDLLASRNPMDLLLEPDSASSYQRPLDRMLKRDPTILSEMRSIGKEALDRANGGRSFSLSADFEGHSADHKLFQRVQLLRRADLLRMRAVEVQRVGDGALLDLKQASSGELGIVTGFLGLASVIEDGSLVFIDEPEISLHPEWQTGYIDLLLKTFGKYGGSHFVLATHSPMILSDVSAENSNVVSLDADRREAEDAVEFSGRSSDYLLVSAFRAPGKNNLYLKQEVIKALRLAADGKAASEQFTEILERLVELLPEMEDSSPVAELIRELQLAASESTAR